MFCVFCIIVIVRVFRVCVNVCSFDTGYEAAQKVIYLKSFLIKCVVEGRRGKHM